MLSAATADAVYDAVEAALAQPAYRPRALFDRFGTRVDPRWHRNIVARLEALKPIQDPEIRIGIVDLGLVYDALIEDDGKVTVKMTLTTPGCPYGEMVMTMVHKAVGQLEGVTSVEVKLVWSPPWDPRTMASDEAKDMLGIW